MGNEEAFAANETGTAMAISALARVLDKTNVIRMRDFEDELSRVIDSVPIDHADRGATLGVLFKTLLLVQKGK